MSRTRITVIFLGILTLFLSTAYFLIGEAMREKPAICRYCHFVTPFYKRWEMSSHRMVPCLKCHEYGPLNAISGEFRLIAGAYTRPIADIPDSNCMQKGCHAQRLTDPHPVAMGNIVFDHRYHYSGKPMGIGLHCRSCHRDLVQGEHIKVSKNVCYLCHLGKRKAETDQKECLVCHGGLDRNTLCMGRPFNHARLAGKSFACRNCHPSVTVGDGFVPREKCASCHRDRTQRYADSSFIHRLHVTDKQINCFECHQIVEHGR